MSRSVRLAGAAALAGALALAAGCGGSANPAAGSPASTSPAPLSAGPEPASGSAGPQAASGPAVTAGSGYLVLGDSVSFGYREQATTPKPDYGDAASFVGFPEDVAAGLGLRLANAACPGETSASFVTPGAASIGCENSPGQGPAYRTSYPLHVSYSGTQLAYADGYLRAHPDTRLVTLMIGANDGFLCQLTTKDRCVSELPTLLATVRRNVTTILGDLRGKDGYRGQIVLVRYYSTDYTSALSRAASQALNGAAESAAKPYDVGVADGYGLFERAAAQVGGDTCKAGLLTFLSPGKCGIHPSAAGQALLALAVEKAVKH